MDRTELLMQAEAFFCKAMATDGYASGAGAKPVVGMPGWKGYDFRENDFRLQDFYFVQPQTRKSVGFTRIYHQGRFIWWMPYGGFYQKPTTTSLKWTLLKAYKDGRFIGGRGPRYHKENCFHYSNHPESEVFENFRGHEEMLNDRRGMQRCGYHSYWGMALI